MTCQESLKLLLETKAEFKSATRGGDTPLTYAIKKDSIKCVDLLFKAGVPIKESDARLALEVSEEILCNSRREP